MNKKYRFLQEYFIKKISKIFFQYFFQFYYYFPILILFLFSKIKYNYYKIFLYIFLKLFSINNEKNGNYKNKLYIYDFSNI